MSERLILLCCSCCCRCFLCVQINASPFFSMPLANSSTDTYIASMAQAVAKTLSADLSVYIEFGQGGPGWMSTDLVSIGWGMKRCCHGVFVK